jgi:hypothetical protein
MLYSSAFIETNDSCSGPLYNKTQKSREDPGTIMTNIQNKYIPEFELPYKNVDRYIKEVKNSWDKLDENQRNSIRKSFTEMNLVDKIENFGEEATGSNIDDSVNFLYADENNIKKLLDITWKPTNEQKEKYKITNEKNKNFKNKLYTWSVDNTFVFHSNWKSGLASFLVILLVLFLGILIGHTTK